MQEKLDDGVFKSILKDGTITYQKSNGYFHRSNGPARISPLGEIEFFYDGVRYREKGPAVDYIGEKADYPDFKPQYWYNGFQYSKEKFEEMIESKEAQRKARFSF